ncbi:hypothetical protein GJ496_000010 [Pomphorhynchus laevis]|nr:hypothetical protein GJ496_000010 [Pomphorhynchus laevis]
MSEISREDRNEIASKETLLLDLIGKLSRRKFAVAQSKANLLKLREDIENLKGLMISQRNKIMQHELSENEVLLKYIQ